MLICLGPNYPNHKGDCEEQCDSCREFQYDMEHPKKISKKKREEMKRNYESIMKNAILTAMILIMSSCFTVKDLPLDDCTVVSPVNWDMCIDNQGIDIGYMTDLSKVNTHPDWQEDIIDCKHVSNGFTTSTLVFCQSCNTSVYKCFKCGEYIKEEL